MEPMLVIVLQSLSFIALIVLIFLIIRLLKKDDQAFNEKLISFLNEFSEKWEKLLKDELGRTREEQNKNARAEREELSGSIKLFSDQLFNRMTDIAKMQKTQLDIFAEQLTKLTSSNEEKIGRLQEKVEAQLKNIQENNEKKLEEMRNTVDEKLQSTLEKRLGESFKQVSERLEQVHKGLGEMQTLATGVGDLKKVLTNVKTRGTWGEIQLGNLIEQILTPEQYSANVETKKGSGARVEFAIKFPGRNGRSEEILWLPIDAKFPLEDYQRLLEAQDAANPELVETAAKEIEKRIKLEAKNISSKYLDPPATTDFAILFLPIEGLFAEVLRRPGLADSIQREYRILLAGPTTLASILNSLQMGFRTLAIEKRSSEVWQLLGAVKTEFGKFGEILEKTHDKLEQASKSIGDATRKTRTIERKLRDVQELPAAEGIKLLGENADEEELQDI